VFDLNDQNQLPLSGVAGIRGIYVQLALPQLLMSRYWGEQICPM